MPDVQAIVSEGLLFALALCAWLLLLAVTALRLRSYTAAKRISKKDDPAVRITMTSGVSVVITARDQAEQLERNLPHVLAQEGVRFEVVVVTDVSTDETADVVARFAAAHPNMRTTFIPASSRYIDRKKLAVTLGVRAARYEWIVLTEPDCLPADSHWLEGLSHRFSPDVDVVLGYANYADDGSRYASRIIYERLKDNLRRFAAADAGLARGGDGCNLAFRKSTFLAKKGFADSLTITCGADDLLVHALAGPRRTAVVPHAACAIRQELPAPDAYASRRIAYAETCRHLGRRARLQQLREGLASSFSWLLMLVFTLYIAIRSEETVRTQAYDTLRLAHDLPALLSLIVAPLIPALLLRGSLNVTGEKRFGLRPAFYDLAQPFRWWRRKWQRFRYRHDFVRKQ